MTPVELMRIAIEHCRTGIAAGQSPFGCAIARDNELLAVEHNRVWQTTDPTAHAEVNAIRAACLKTGSIDLTGCVAATTCEPCPMCMSALHWARASEVHFGARVADARRAGFSEIDLAAEQVAQAGGGRVHVSGELLADECRALFAEWMARHDRRPY